MPGSLPGSAEELLVYLQPKTPVRVPVLPSLYEQIVKQHPSLEDYLVVTEFDDLTLHISNFIASHLRRPLSESTLKYLVVWLPCSFILFLLFIPPSASSLLDLYVILDISSEAHVKGRTSTPLLDYVELINMRLLNRLPGLKQLSNNATNEATLVQTSSASSSVSPSNSKRKLVMSPLEVGIVLPKISRI